MKQIFERGLVKLVRSLVSGAGRMLPKIRCRFRSTRPNPLGIPALSTTALAARHSIGGGAVLLLEGPAPNRRTNKSNPHDRELVALKVEVAPLNDAVSHNGGRQFLSAKAERLLNLLLVRAANQRVTDDEESSNDKGSADSVLLFDSSSNIGQTETCGKQENTSMFERSNWIRSSSK